MSDIASGLDPEKVLLGITPTLRWNDDFLSIDIGIPFGQCVSEMALAGFQGCSVGHKYPTAIAVLKSALDLRGLRVSEPWVSTYFTIKDMEAQTLDAFHHQLEFIKAMGGTDMVVAEFGQSTHHHMGTGVMTRADVDRLMESTDPDLVHLLLDTGHLAFAGDDPPGDGAIDFVPQAQRAADQHRLHYVHISAPDRGAVHDSWIPWELFLEPILPRYDRPLLVESFNAIPAFLSSLHLTRRNFWIPGEDPPDSSAPDAYTVAGEAIAAVRTELDSVKGSR